MTDTTEGQTVARREKFLACAAEAYDAHVWKHDAPPQGVFVLFLGMGQRPTMGSASDGLSESDQTCTLLGDMAIMSRSYWQDAMSRPHVACGASADVLRVHHSVREILGKEFRA